jgi:hypothetical protein
MSKKMKLSLENLKIKSFVTDLEKKEAVKIKGGYTEGELCDSNFTCNFKCGHTAWWECTDTRLC